MTTIRTYLDHNATSPVRPEVTEAMVRALETGGNPSSVHAAGRAAREMVEKARDQVAALCGCGTSDVTFTSGGTEANNLCLRSMHAAGYRLFVSATEHPSVMETALELDATIIPVDEQGVVLAEALDALLANSDGKQLVSVMAANNETGALQDIGSLAKTAKKHGALFHTDAVQAIGKISFNMRYLSVDLVTVSAHKIGGPAGVGALVINPSVGIMKGIVTGGGQEKGLRPGTENLAGIAGFGAAADAANTGLQDQDRIRALRDKLEQQILDIAPQTQIFGNKADRIGNTSCFAMSGVESDVQVMSLDLEGIAVSAGAACSSGKVAASPVLLAMGIEKDIAGSALRVSLGWNTTEEEVSHFVEAWKGLYERLADKTQTATRSAA